METGNAVAMTTSAQLNFNIYTNNSDTNGSEEDALAEKRINDLLAAQSETMRRNGMFSSEHERVEADLMKSPLSVEKTFSHFGLLLGTYPPAAIFARLLFNMQGSRLEDFWLLGLAFTVVLISATVGYFSGKSIGRTVFELEKQSWTKMILVSPFVGMCWGILAGGAGGAIIFLIGGLAGALLGAIVGAVALPIFTVFHRLLKRGDQIEEKHFLPLAFGTAFMISAFVLGL